MECPICGKEMEQGFIQGNQRVAWVKSKHKISILPQEGEVLLDNKTFGSLLFTAWICKDCEKILLDYSDKNHQEG